MITLNVNPNGSFAAKPRAEDKNLQEIIQILPHNLDPALSISPRGRLFPSSVAGTIGGVVNGI